MLLDVDEFVPYVGDVALEAEALARELGVFVAPYRSEPVRTSEHLQLCQTFAPALLCAEELEQELRVVRLRIRRFEIGDGEAPARLGWVPGCSSACASD
jgi:hypothetical protein